MFSRLTSLIILISFSLQACSLKVNESASTASEIKLNSSVSNGCLSAAPEVLQKYFNGDASESETSELWNCLIRSFELFHANVRGSLGSDYTPNELATFLEYYFLKNRKIPQPLLDELMLLKTVVLGGSPQKVTKDELFKTMDIFRSLRTETLRLRTYMPFDYELLKKLPPDQFELAMTTFESATQNIARTFEKNVRPYNLKNLDRLFTELDSYFSSGSNKADVTSWIKTALRYTKLFRAAKSVFIAPPADEISVNDWKHVFYIVPRYYTLVLRAFYYYDSKSIGMSGEGLEKVVTLFVNTHQLMTRTLSYHPGRLLRFEEIDLFLDELDAQKLLPIPSPILKDAVKTIFKKLLTDATVGEGGKPELRGISLRHMRVMEEQFFLWSEAQHFLTGIYQNKAGSLKADISRTDFMRVNLEEALAYTQLKSEVSERAIEDWLQTPRSLRSLFPNESPVILLNGDKGENYSFHNSTHMNWMRTVARLILRGYISEPERSRQGNQLSKDEINAFYKDFYPLAVELGFLARSSGLNAASQRFLEADLFSFSANGDNFLSMNEGLELLSLAVSTVTKGKDTHLSIVNSCGSIGVDPDKAPLVELDCYRRAFINGISLYFNHTPGFANYINKLSDKVSDNPEPTLVEELAALFEIKPTAMERAENEEHKELSPRELIIRNLEKIVRGYQPQDTRPVEVTHSQSFTLMSYYVEALFEKFDKDNSGTINVSEAALAYPTFRDFLTKAAAKEGVTRPRDVETLFYFIMKYGKIPETLSEKLLFKWRTWRPRWSFETDRGQVLKIFAALLDSSKK